MPKSEPEPSITVTDVDPLLFSAVNSGAVVLPPEHSMSLSHPDYVVLDGALTAIYDAQNSAVADVHQRVARRMSLISPSRRGDRGSGYVPIREHVFDHRAISRHVQALGGTTAGILATAYSLGPARARQRPLGRALERFGRAATVETHPDYLALRRIARVAILHDFGKNDDASLQPRLYGKALGGIMRKQPPQIRAKLAVGVLSAYQITWEQTGRNPGFARIMGRLDTARLHAVNDVYEQTQGMARGLDAKRRLQLHHHIGDLSLRALRLRMDAVIAPRRQGSPGTRPVATTD